MIDYFTPILHAALLMKTNNNKKVLYLMQCICLESARLTTGRLLIIGVADSLVYNLHIFAPCSILLHLDTTYLRN